MKILFFMRHSGYSRNFESTLCLLAERGHQIHLAFERRDKAQNPGVLSSLREQYPNISQGPAPRPPPNQWGRLVREAGLAADYLRYLEPRYRDAPKLRQRAEALAPELVRRLTGRSLLRSTIGLRVLGRGLRLLEEAAPNCERIDAFLREQQPDIVLLTPLVELGSWQADYVRSAKRLGIRTGLLVHSWDNLTNKGLIRDAPDFVAVWNETQKREAVELHRMPADRVVLTGAVSYDHWFDWSPSRDRAQFCQRVGLRADRPFLLYLCSSPFIAGHEVTFIQDWLAELRTWADGRLREVGVLVRPHPQHAEQWQDAQLDALENVTVWPRAGADPTTPEAKADYYDSIHHSAGVVGLNTSALIESAIVGRPVHTLLTPEYRDTQEGTLHFHYLLRVNGGLLHAARTFEEHATQLAAAVAGQADDDRGRRFLQAFVRPAGLGEPATPRLVEAIEVACANPSPRPRRRSAVAEMLYVLLNPMLEYAERRKKGRVGFGKLILKSAARHALQCLLLVGPVRRLAASYVLPALNGAALRLSSKLDSLEAAPSDAPAATERRQAPERPPQSDLSLERDLTARAAEAVDLLVDRSEAAVIAGPWLSEVGFELLYWIPFLNWATGRRPELSERLVVVSRGGAAHWYTHVSPRYVDVFDYLSREAYLDALQRAAAARNGKQKQRLVSDFDLGLIQRIRERLKLDAVELLHPSVMYEFFRETFKDDAVHRMGLISKYQTLPLPDAGKLSTVLPDDYVAVRFYFNYSFPDTEENRSFVTAVIKNLTDKTNVVMLNTGMRLDDHWDYDSFESERVTRLDRLIKTNNNLDIQTITISRARAFVGTYGGLSYLPPFFNVPSICFYSKPERFNQCHLELANRVFRHDGWGSFVALHTKHLDLLGAIGDISRKHATRLSVA